MKRDDLSAFDHPSAWYAADLSSRPETWTVRLSTGALAELMTEAQAIGRDTLSRITAQPVEPSRLPLAAGELAAIEREVMTGRGFVLLKGLDPDAADGTLKACYWIMAHLLGVPISQNAYGDLLCDVRDTGKQLGKQVRGYQTKADLKFHTDRADLVGLLCVRKAMEGGLSSISSAVSVYNELLKTRPDLLDPLFKGLNYMNVEEGGNGGFKRVPIFDIRDHVLSCRYSRNTMATAIRSGAPFTDQEKDALDVIDQLAADPRLRLDMVLERGDIQLINNYTTLHSRTAFEDYPEEHLKRCMTRMWVHSTIGRRVGAHFGDYGGVPATLTRTAV